jgi:hypothetical protein
MKFRFLLSIALLTLTGSAAALTESGATKPCDPDRRGSQVCANAIFNATVIGQIHKGQSQDDVRGIMRHDPERTEIQGVTESWGYMTSHKDSMITWITFTDRRVSSLSHESIAR